MPHAVQALHRRVMRMHWKPWRCARSKFSGKKDRIIKIKRKVKTTRLAGGLLCPYKGLFPACARKAHWQSANCTTFTAAPSRGYSSASLFRRCPKRGLLVCFDFLLLLQAVYFLFFFTGSPVNGSIYSTNDIWSYSKSSFSWFWIYALIAAVFLPAVST